MGWRRDVEHYCRQCQDCSSFVRGRRIRRSGCCRSRDTGSTCKSWVDENACDEVIGDNGSQTSVRGVNGRADNVGQTAGSEALHTDVHLGGVGKRLSLAYLTTSGSIDKSGDGNRSTALHLSNEGDDDGPTMDVDEVRVHSTGDEYDNGRAGNAGETAASGSGSANTNGHLGYVVGRISLAGVATTRQINDRSGSREVIGLATQDGGVTVHPPGVRVDNNGAGNVDDSRINGLPEDVMGRNPQVGPVSADETNGPAGSADVLELTVQGNAGAVYSSVDGVNYDVSPSTVCEANVEPVVSTMGFAGLNEGNDDAGQHELSENPEMNDDVVPVLGSLVQGDADRRQSTTVANADDGSGPRHRTSGPGSLLVNEGQSTGNSDADGADVLVFVPKGHDQHRCSTAMGQGYRGLCHLNNGVGAGRQRCKSRPNNVPVALGTR